MSAFEFALLNVDTGELSYAPSAYAHSDRRVKNRQVVIGREQKYLFVFDRKDRLRCIRLAQYQLTPKAYTHPFELEPKPRYLEVI